MEQLSEDMIGAKIEPGATKRDIFRCIIREGGYTKEPLIRKFLFQNNGLLNESGVKKHLKTMEADNLIRKDGSPGAANIIYLAAEEPECYHYLCELIGRSHTDPSIAKDIREFFTKTNASEDSITAHMVANNAQRFCDYIAVLDREFVDKRPAGLQMRGSITKNAKGALRTPDDETVIVAVAEKPPIPFTAGTQPVTENEKNKSGDAGFWSVDDETMKMVYSVAQRSPSLFAVGTQPANALFLAFIRALIETRTFPGEHPHNYFRWLISHAIAASLITDLHIYDMHDVLLIDHENMKDVFTHFNEDFGDLWLFCSERVKKQFIREDDGTIHIMDTK